PILARGRRAPEPQSHSKLRVQSSNRGALDFELGALSSGLAYGGRGGGGGGGGAGGLGGGGVSGGAPGGGGGGGGAGGVGGAVPLVIVTEKVVGQLTLPAWRL